MTKSSSSADSTALRDATVLRRVNQLGSARDGLQEWRLQRLTALALIPLGLYFTASLLRLATSDRLTAADWLGSPVPALLVIHSAVQFTIQLAALVLIFMPASSMWFREKRTINA